MFELKEGQVYWNKFGTKIYIEELSGSYVFVSCSTVRYGKEESVHQMAIDNLIRHMNENGFTLFREE